MKFSKTVMISMKYLTFFIKLSEIVDHHVPLTKVTKKERTLQSKPWINKEIKHLMQKRDKLFLKYCARMKLKKN